MGKARLNIWVRDEKCRVIKKPGHLHIFNCLEEEVFGTYIPDGHAEAEIPPGCYIVVAGMYTSGRNIYTDKTMVIVRCGDEACVNLILPEYEESKTAGPQLARLAIRGCPMRLIPALGVHAIRKNIDPKEAFDVLIKTAEIDRGQLIAAIEKDIEELRENMDEIRKAAPEEEKEAREYMERLEKIKAMIAKISMSHK